MTDRHWTHTPTCLYCGKAEKDCYEMRWVLRFRGTPIGWVCSRKCIVAAIAFGKILERAVTRRG